MTCSISLIGRISLHNYVMSEGPRPESPVRRRIISLSEGLRPESLVFLLRTRDSGHILHSNIYFYGQEIQASGLHSNIYFYGQEIQASGIHSKYTSMEKRFRRQRFTRVCALLCVCACLLCCFIRAAKAHFLPSWLHYYSIMTLNGP